MRTGKFSWLYNDSDDGAGDLSIMFVGDTAHAVSPGDISYFFLASWNQPDVLLTMLSTKLPGVSPWEHDRKGLTRKPATSLQGL